MRGLKRFAALFVAIAMLLSMLTFSVTVSAEEISPAVKITEDDNLLIEKLKTLGAISGEYSPSAYVTRRQMARIIREYMNLPQGISGSGKADFNDVSADDADYNAIDSLYDLEIITGDDKGNFRPDDYVNYNEAVVFIINAIGHKYFAVREGGFPTGYMRIAIKHDMLDDLNMTKGTAFVPVIDVYKMLNAALTASTVITEYYGDDSVRYVISDTENFLSENYDVLKYRGKVTGNEYTSLSYTKMDITDEQIAIDDKVYDTPGCFYGYFLGYTVDYYVKQDKASGLYEVLYVEETPKKNSTFNIDSEDILTSEVTASRIYFEDENDERDYINVDSTVDVVFNGQFYTGYGSLKNIMPVNGYIEALDNNSDNEYDVLFIYDYQTVVVDSVDTYDETISDRITNSVIDLSQNVHKVNIVSAKDGLPVYLESVQKGDILNIAISRGAEKVMTAYVSDKVVSGQITGYVSNLGYEIGGTYYKASYNYADDALTVGLSGNFYLDMNDRIAAYKYDTSSTKEYFAVMAGVDYNETSTMNPDIKVKLYTTAGEFLTAPLKENVKINNVKYDLSDSGDVDSTLSLLCEGYTSGGKYSVYDSYVLRYTTTLDNEIATIDTGAIGGVGHINILADRFTFMANRSGNMMYLTKSATGEKMYTRLSSEGIVFMVPTAGNLNDEKLYSIVTKVSGDHSYANPANRDNNFPGASTTEIENFTAYYMGSGEIPVIDALLLRGGGSGASLSDDTTVYVLTEVSDSADEEGMTTKTLYQSNERIGQLAETVTVTRAGTTTNYDSQTLIANNIIKQGSAIRCSTDDKGKISEIEMISEYDYNTESLTPLFSTAGTYIGSNSLWAVSKANHGVGVINAYDVGNQLLDFTCGEYDLLGDMGYSPVVKIYDTATNKIRNATPGDIRVGDKCVLRLRIFYRVQDLIIFR